MRPMWLEYPENDAMFNISSQFMFGDSFLFAPKLGETTQEIDVFLPNETRWYSMANYTFGEYASEAETQDKSIFSKIKDKFHHFKGKVSEPSKP